MILLKLNLVSCIQKPCHLLNVGSNIQTPSTSHDVILAGLPMPNYRRDSETLKFVPSSKHIEYFYISDLKINLSQDDITLTNPDPEFANSSFKLVKQNSNYYTIEIDYQCSDYGGSIMPVRI